MNPTQGDAYVRRWVHRDTHCEPARVPLTAQTQVREKIPRVGVLEPGSQQHPFPCLPAFQQGLRYLGYLEGHNIFLEYRYAENQPDRLPALAAELVQRQPDAIWTSSSSAAQALKQATTTIPIVVGVAVDLVEQGLVESLARPWEPAG
jgi:putative ABC transport system substrate-binding protein